jgi:TatD DNase family protein
MNFFDSHSHYNDNKFDEDRDSLLKETYREGITKILCAGYSLKSSKEAIEIAERHQFVYATARNISK